MRSSQAPISIPSLDGIRGISFLFVFLAHAGLDGWVPGGLGVTMFFFLSGYLITTIMRQELAETCSVSFKHFYLRRALRILPPFYTVLLGAAALSAAGILAGPPQGAPLLAQLFHFANYWTVLYGYQGQSPGTGVYWSLAVEEHFYLLFPALFALLYRREGTARTRAAFLWGLCLLVLAWRCALVFGAGVQMNRTYMATDTRVDSILFGCALAVFGNPALDPQSPRERLLWLRVLLPASAALLLLCLLFRGERFRETFRYSMQGLALYPLFICAVRNPRLWPFRWLNHPLLRRIGELSYSLYLLHHVVIAGVQRWLHLPAVVRGTIAFGISLLLSIAIWRFIEQPCAKLRRRLTHRAPARTPRPPVAIGARA